MRTDVLNNALAAVGGFSNRRTPNEAYSKTYLLSRDGKLSVMAMCGDGACVVHTEEVWNGNAALACDTFAAVVRNYDCGEINLKLGTSLTVEADNSQVSLPIHSVPIPSVPVPQEGIVVNKEEWMNAARCMAFTESEKEIEFAQGQRLLAKDGLLYFLSAAKGGMNGISVDAKGSMDVIVPSSALVATTTAIRKAGGDTVSLLPVGGGVVISSGTMVANVVTVEGKRPHGRDVFDKTAMGAVRWNVPHAELLKFLKQARQFVSEFHTGIDMEATDEGLALSFSAVDDAGEVSPVARGTCRALIVGKFEPARVCIKHAPLYGMVDTAGEKMEFSVKHERGVFVTSGRYFAGYAHMTRVATK